MKTQKQIYRLWIYDTWGNDQEGYWVNDRSRHGLFTLRVKGVEYNPGTPHAFTSYDPTDRQLNRLIGAQGLIWEGDPKYTLTAATKRGKPICELERVEDETEEETPDAMTAAITAAYANR